MVLSDPGQNSHIWANCFAICSIYEEPITAPCSHFLDGVVVKVIQVYCNGCYYSEDVATYMMFEKAMFGEL